jgi:hypothetical protein
MLRIKWTKGLKNGKVSQSDKEERLFLKNKKKEMDATRG